LHTSLDGILDETALPDALGIARNALGCAWIDDTVAVSERVLTKLPERNVRSAHGAGAAIQAVMAALQPCVRGVRSQAFLLKTGGACDADLA